MSIAPKLRESADDDWQRQVDGRIPLDRLVHLEGPIRLPDDPMQPCKLDRPQTSAERQDPRIAVSRVGFLNQRPWDAGRSFVASVVATALVIDPRSAYRDWSRRVSRSGAASDDDADGQVVSPAASGFAAIESAIESPLITPDDR